MTKKAKKTKVEIAGNKVKIGKSPELASLTGKNLKQIISKPADLETLLEIICNELDLLGKNKNIE